MSSVGVYTIISQGFRGSISDNCRVTKLYLTISGISHGSTSVILKPQTFAIGVFTPDRNRSVILAPNLWMTTSPIPVGVGELPIYNFASATHTTDLGPVRNQINTDIEKVSVPAISIQIQCTGDSANGLAATARVYGSSATRSSTYPDLATFDKEPYLGISLRPPATAPASTITNTVNVTGGVLS